MSRTVLTVAFRFGDEAAVFPLPDSASTSIFVRFRLNPDGTIAGRPEAIKSSSPAATQDVSDGVIAGIEHCQPHDLLQEGDYKRWQRVLLRIGIAYKPAGPDAVGISDWARGSAHPLAPIKRFPIEDAHCSALAATTVDRSCLK